MDIKLYQAAIAGDDEAYAKLKDTAHDKIESMGNKTILHVESMHGCTEYVEYILREFGNREFLAAVDSNQETALHLAAYFGHTEVVGVLIEEAKRLFSDDPNIYLEAFVRKSNGKKNTALHLAVSNHNVDIVKLLAETDPEDTHIVNREGNSPIYLAAKWGYNDIVKLICETCRAPRFNGPRGKTALHAAITKLHEAKKEDSDAVKILLEKAKVVFSEEHNRFKNFVGQADYKYGDTALHLAVRGNHLDVVKLLSQVDGPHKTQINMDKKTPLYIAAEQGYKEVVKQLLCETCKFENISGPRDQTALHAAIIGRDPDCVDYVLKKDERLVTYGDDVGWTPLHYAAYYKFDSIIETIVKAQASVRYQSVYGDHVPTPLCVAAKEGHTSTVILLLKLSPSSCASVNYDGQNILHLAAMASDKEMIRCILNCCPTEYTDKIVNHKDVNGDTPLHLLIREGCFVFELIKYKGVDTMAKNYHNWVPFDMLYFHDDIIGDQLQIKKVLDDIQTNHQRKSYINDSLVPPTRRSKKDEEFKKAKESLMKKGLELYKERTSTQIIVTALITTVTFTVGFTMPGGVIQSGQQDEGLVLFSKKTAFRAFLVSDALALLLSTTSLFLYFISSMYRDPHKVSKFNHASTGLNIFSVIAMMLTFITGTYVVLSDSVALAITSSIIGCIFFVIVIVILIKMLQDRRKEDKYEV